MQSTPRGICIESVRPLVTLGHVGAFGFAASTGIDAIVWVACGLFCVAWFARYESGPAEWLLRTVAYATSRRRRRDAAAMLATAPAV